MGLTAPRLTEPLWDAAELPATGAGVACLAIDPGPTQSAWLVLGPRGGPRAFATWPNERLLEALRRSHEGPGRPDGRERFTEELAAVVIEKVESFGMAVGAEVFETVYWSGMFAEAARPLRVDRLGRRAVKLHLCGKANAKDANIRQALVDRYGSSASIGTKKAPGPLYGVARDAWSALAVAVTWADLQRGRR